MFHFRKKKTRQKKKIAVSGLQDQHISGNQVMIITSFKSHIFLPTRPQQVYYILCNSHLQQNIENARGLLEQKGVINLY